MENIQRVPVECVVVGLDMSLTGTGVCVKRGMSIQVETIKTTPISAPNDLARLQFIVSEVMRRIPKETMMICTEDFFTPMNRQQIGAAIKLAMLGTAMRLSLYAAGLPFTVVSPSQIKKFSTGKGVGQKSIVVREVYKRWGVDVKDDNQADACVLAYIAEGILVPHMEMAQYQKETIDKIIKERPRYNWCDGGK